MEKIIGIDVIITFENEFCFQYHFKMFKTLVKYEDTYETIQHSKK